MRAKVIALLAFSPLALSGQIAFTESTSQVTRDFHSGSAVVSADMNGDTYDDIVRLNGGRMLNVQLQGAPDRFQQTFEMQVANNAQWFLIAGDVNNDGLSDICTGGPSDRIKLLTQLPFTHEYFSEQISDARFFAQAANMVDVNHDCDLDIFVCNDDGANFLFLSDGEGAYFRDTSLMDFNTVPPSDNSGNYGSVWSDIDMDGDLDLYISKCRIGVVDPADPRRINVLHIQNDSGFVEMADSFGLADGGQSWSSDFADIDNDGDFDLVVINHDMPSRLFENTGGGKFEDITANSGIDLSGLIIQSIFRDFDNDGLIDLLVSGNRVILYRNLGNNQFEPLEDLFPGHPIASFAIGDFNNDGFPDIYSTHNDLYNDPSSFRDDVLWLNDGNENNYVRFKLLGTDCNKGAVGAKLFLYTPSGIQLREIRAGESYGIANSPIHAFGIGADVTADSLVVEWTDGSADSYTGIAINTTHVVEQGACMTEVFDLGQGPYVQCGDDIFNLVAPEGFLSYTWSNGETAASINVNTVGVYSVTMTDGAGCTTISAPVYVAVNDAPAEVEIAVNGEDKKCFGDTVFLVAPEGVSFEWSNGGTGRGLDVTESGSYSVTVTRACDMVSADPLDFVITNPNSFETVNDTLNEPGSGILTADGDSVLWYDAVDAPEPVGSGNSYITPVVDTSTTFFAENTLVIPPDTFTVGMTGHMGGGAYNNDQFNGGLLFDVLSDCVLDSVKVQTDFPARRTIEIKDSMGLVLFSRSFQVDSGTYFLPLAVELVMGNNYVMTTNSDSNWINLGFPSPKLVRSEDEVTYPYVADGFINIKGAEFGVRYYYYFYDWHLSSPAEYCVSDRRPATVVIDTTTGTGDVSIAEITVYPNPVEDLLVVSDQRIIAGATVYTYRIISLDGRVAASGSLDASGTIDVANLQGSMYILELAGGGTGFVARFVKAE